MVSLFVLSTPGGFFASHQPGYLFTVKGPLIQKARLEKLPIADCAQNKVARGQKDENDAEDSFFQPTQVEYLRPAMNELVVHLDRLNLVVTTHAGGAKDTMVSFSSTPQELQP